ncbi:MAG TPA: hypothetical protein VF310_05695 [Vicinamibacteria bacterium]
MGLSVAERGRRLSTFRFVQVRLMEIAAAWTPTTPEMEVKVLLGRHIWDLAQHADALGKRTFELRLPAQHSLRPAEDYVRLLHDVAALEPTAERLAALYDAVLPGLDQRYARYLEASDPLLDAPSRVIVERIRADLARLRAEAQAVRAELGLAAADPAAWRDRERALADLVAA